MNPQLEDETENALTSNDLKVLCRDKINASRGKTAMRVAIKELLHNYNVTEISDLKGDQIEAVYKGVEVIANMQKRIEELEKENTELVAHGEGLRKQLSMAGGTIEYLEDGFPFNDKCKEVKENAYKLIADTKEITNKQ